MAHAVTRRFSCACAALGALAWLAPCAAARAQPSDRVDTGVGTGTGTGTGAGAPGESDATQQVDGGDTVAPEAPAEGSAPAPRAPAAGSGDDEPAADPHPATARSSVRARARHDTVLSWSPRYQLDTTTGPLGLEEQMWRRVDALPLYHRVALDASGLADGLVSIHLAGWGAIDFLADSTGQIAAGDIAIGFVELALEPVRLWAGRRFVTYGPPGGLHVDGGGASVSSSIGLSAEAFVGRPVTPVRTSLLGPQPSFEGAAIAYGARVGWAEAGTAAASAGYAELWSHGIVSSRTVDIAAHWDPGDLRIEAATKLDVRDLGVAQARVGASYRIIPEVGIDADYLHVEPGRWIPPWSILSVFDTSTFDEAIVGSTVRPVRALAIRAEAAGRLYSSSNPQDDEPRLGYRAEISARVIPTGDPGPRLRFLASRRDDGTIGYTLVQLGAAFDPFAAIVVSLDGSFAIDDAGGRDAVIGRANVDWEPIAAWKIGLTVSVARTPIVEAETRAMLRVRWTPEVP